MIYQACSDPPKESPLTEQQNEPALRRNPTALLSAFISFIPPCFRGLTKIQLPNSLRERRIRLWPYRRYEEQVYWNEGTGDAKVNAAIVVSIGRGCDDLTTY